MHTHSSFSLCVSGSSHGICRGDAKADACTWCIEKGSTCLPLSHMHAAIFVGAGDEGGGGSDGKQLLSIASLLPDGRQTPPWKAELFHLPEASW